MFPFSVRAATCKTQSQLSASQSEDISLSAHSIADAVERADIPALRTDTIAAITDFSGISGMVQSTAPLVSGSAVTIDSLYLLDASAEPPDATRIDFYCGSPLVVLNINDLPPGNYAFVIMHFTGVAHPQQISLILSEKGDHGWMLAGLFVRPMLLAGHSGEWYLRSAQQFARQNMKWNAWFYYRLAAATLQPVEFLSSPNLDALKQQQESVHPDNLPGATPIILASGASAFRVVAIDTTDLFGTLDLDVRYLPDGAQLAELRDPPAARKQVVAVMAALLALHPEFREGFHGMWLQAEHDNASVFSLELPMSGLNGADASTLASSSVAITDLPKVGRGDPTIPEVQMSLAVSRDPIASPDEDQPHPEQASKTPLDSQSGDIHKLKDGLYTMHKDVDEVLLTCAVVDEKGRAVRDLNRENFTVWEDGVQQTTTSFLHQDQPVALGILVDNSGSMLDKHPAINAAAFNMLKVLNSADRTFIVNFSDKAFLDQPFTSNVSALSRGLARFQSGGTTALYDAIASSADELARDGSLPKQVLLVITDGSDNGSHLTLEGMISRVQNLGGPVVYSIGLLFDNDKQESRRARAALEQLSQKTGGVAYFPRSMEDMNSIGIQVADDIRDQYTVGYHSSISNTLGGYRTVLVKANSHGHTQLTVRTRKGYFATRPAAATTASAHQPVQ